MSELRDLVAALDFSDVRTLLASGNVVFRAPPGHGAEHARRIERAIAERAGFHSRVLVLDAAELRAVVQGNPLGDVATEPSRLAVAFPMDPGDLPRLRSLEADCPPPERFVVGERAAYLWCPDGYSNAEMPERVQRLLGDGVTTRNWATTVKLLALADSSR
jgi:uncharacterized protein (DUF1697 family)